VYRHTQIGYLTLIVILVAALGIVASLPNDVRPITFGVAGLLVIIGVLFSSLTVDVTGDDLQFHFGPGFWRKRVALSEVTAATPTESSWWEGWGIRFTLRGMLYNVSGTNAVEIELRSGQRFRIGTDEPEALVQAIRAAISAPHRT
jgi:energy-coupling factor transporter transmembrane protein EcfT